MEEPIYQLPHFCYFVDAFEEDGVLGTKAFILSFDQELVMPFGYDKEEDKYFDFSQTYFTVSTENIDDFSISNHLLGKRHMTDLGDIIGEVYETDMEEEANQIYAQYKKEYVKKFLNLDLGTEQKEHSEIIKIMDERLGRRPAIKIKDLGFFISAISQEMQKRSQERLAYFYGNWTSYYSQNGKKECTYQVPDEVNNLLELLEPFDSC